VREDRIHNEAIVDARPEEQAMGWYYYLESKISFPFQARCVAANAVSPLRKGETTEVLAWPLKMPASTTCLYRSVGRGGR
jgi:Calcium binding